MVRNDFSSSFISGTACADSGGGNDEDVDKDVDKDEDEKGVSMILLISLYFCSGRFTRSDTFGTVNVDCKWL